MLVKDLVSAFKPSSPREKIYFVFYNEEGELCLSNDYDFVIDVLGNVEVIGWRIVKISDPGRFGSFDNELHIMVKSAPVSNDVVETDEEFEERNQEFLESLNEMPEPSKYDNHDIRNLKLPARVMNRLTEFGIESVGDLRNFSRKDLLEVKGLAKRGVDIIEHRLYQLGLGLKKGE